MLMPSCKHCSNAVQFQACLDGLHAWGQRRHFLLENDGKINALLLQLLSLVIHDSLVVHAW